MSDNHCTVMELYCIEQAKLEPLKRGKWIAQAERWHELGRAQELLAAPENLSSSQCTQARWHQT